MTTASYLILVRNPFDHQQNHINPIYETFLCHANICNSDLLKYKGNNYK